jgi:hypothetical protein
MKPNTERRASSGRREADRIATRQRAVLRSCAEHFEGTDAPLLADIQAVLDCCSCGAPGPLCDDCASVEIARRNVTERIAHERP